MADERLQFCSGYVHGGSITEEPPAYVQEAGVLHAIRARREWLGHRGQTGIRWIEMTAGDGRVNHRIREWMRIGRGSFETPAASGLVEEIRTLPEWPRVDVFMRPFYSNRATAEEDGGDMEDPLAELFIRLAEHFRSVVIPQQGEQWREKLPRIPLTMDELQMTLLRYEDEDELMALQRLAPKGSTSAAIMDFLGLTGDLIREAFTVLRGERRLQVNLASTI